MSEVTSVRIMAAYGPIVVCLGLSKTTAVLSIGRLGVVTGADYYLANVVNSVDDYYLGRGEAPGQEPAGPAPHPVSVRQ